MNTLSFIIMSTILTALFIIGFYAVSLQEEPAIETIPISYPYPDAEIIDFNVSFMTNLPVDDVKAIMNKQSSFKMFTVNESSVEIFAWMMGYNSHHNYSLDDSWQDDNVYFGFWQKEDNGKVKIAYVIPTSNRHVWFYLGQRYFVCWYYYFGFAGLWRCLNT